MSSKNRKYVSVRAEVYACAQEAAIARGQTMPALTEAALNADQAFRDYVPTSFLIRDGMTGRYYCGGNPRLPMMGGTREEATRFDDRMSAAEVLRKMPLTVLAEVEEVPRG